MVMAGTESVSGSTSQVDESLSNRLQWLRQRREALNEKLAQKNNELKNLCIEEAELTGVLPPEIPLEPGENPPNFRKRVGTSFNYSQNLINKLKTGGAEESTLELERQVQINIADAALAILNDPSESKAMRRKHRSIYQQSQRRLQELNAQLNFIRQSHGSGPRHTQSTHIPLHSSQPHLQTTKHRTKKPRPPLDNSGKDLSPKVESRGFLHEGGINLSPLGPEHNYNSYPSFDFQDLAGHNYLQPSSSNTTNQNRMTYHAPSPVDHRRTNAKLLDHDLNINNNMYVAPDHFRNRAYSQGGNSGGSNSASPHHFSDRVYRLMPNTYSDDERQIHYRQMKMKKQDNEEIIRQYPDSRFLDNEVHRRSAQISFREPDINAPRYDNQGHDFSAHYNHGKAQQSTAAHRPRDTVDNPIIPSEHKGNKAAVDTYVPPGYWMRLDDEIVWCTDEQMNDKFGSLDRRKQNIAHHPSNETQSRYHTVTLGGKNTATTTHLRQHPLQPQVHNLEAKKMSSNRILLRTQSLGSVENWQPPNSSHDGSSSVEGRESADGSGRSCVPPTKIKEKEWYETSLDTNTAATASASVTQQQRAVRRASHHNSLVGPLTKDRAPMRSNSIPSNRRPREHQQQQQPQSQQLEEQQKVQRPPLPQNRYIENRLLEIPAESKPSLGSQENGNEPIIPLNSTTIVQPGKYQPYREVTKPFEMSDFYKYSTKFRKRVEANAINEQQQKSTNLNTQNDQNQANNPIQRIHQPVQRNTCPSYTLR